MTFRKYEIKALDAFFQFHERAVVGDGDDLAAHARAFGELVLDALPRVLGELLEAGGRCAPCFR